MVVVGADVHKRAHTFAGVDQVGRELGCKTFPATTAGHQAAVMWARERFGPQLRAAVEDCRHLSARLGRDLLGAGQAVVRVPPKMMAGQRRIARTRGKCDPIDAAAAARAALREPGWPAASHDEASRELKLLADRREDLVKDRTATISRLRWRVHELEPSWAPKARSLDRARHQQLLAGRLDGVPGLVAELARDELADVTGLDRRDLPVQVRGRLRPPRRHRTRPGLVRQHQRPGPADQVREPPAQRRDPPHRRHPDPPRRPRPGLLRKEKSRRQAHHRSPAVPQTTHRTHRLQAPEHRRCRQASHPRPSGLT